MIYKISLLALIIGSGWASANDKDVLRDACGAIKVASKKSQCFDALERLVVSAPPATPPPQPAPTVLKISPRGLSCEPMEFSEIDAMPRDELEGLYCSYVLASRLDDESHNRLMEQAKSDPNARAFLLRKHLVELGKCTRGLSKAMDVIQRKYPGTKTDCAKLPLPKLNAPMTNMGDPTLSN